MKSSRFLLVTLVGSLVATSGMLQAGSDSDLGIYISDSDDSFSYRPYGETPEQRRARHKAVKKDHANRARTKKLKKMMHAAKQHVGVAAKKLGKFKKRFTRSNGAAAEAGAGGGASAGAGSGTVTGMYTPRELAIIDWIDANPDAYKKLKKGPFVGGRNIKDPRKMKDPVFRNRTKAKKALKKNKAAGTIQKAFRNAKQKKAVKHAAAGKIQNAFRGYRTKKRAKPAMFGTLSQFAETGALYPTPVSRSGGASGLDSTTIASPHTDRPSESPVRLSPGQTDHDTYWDNPHAHPGYGDHVYDDPDYTDPDYTDPDIVPARVAPTYDELVASTGVNRDFPARIFTHKELEQIKWIIDHPDIFIPKASDPREQKRHLRSPQTATTE
jgi:hypothetical protein